MDTGLPMSLLTTLGEIVFNDLSGDCSSSNLSDTAVPVWPGPGVVHLEITGWGDVFTLGLPPGNGYLMQFVGGMHGSNVRATVDNRPHKAGGIIHRFYDGPKYFTLDGLCVGDTPEIRQVLYDFLVGWIRAAQQADGRFFMKAPGVGETYEGTNKGVRFMTMRSYDATEIIGPQGSPGSSPGGIAAPKQYVAQCVAVNPYWYTYTERDTTILGGASAFISNNGTVETWPVIEVFCVAHGAGASFTLDNGTFDVEWAGALTFGDHIEVNMFNETMYLNGNSTNKISGLNDDSDFWSIPSGGCTVSVTPGADHIIVKSNDAWV